MMRKIWNSTKIKIKNRFDFILYGQRIGYINILTIIIDLIILLYSIFDFNTLIHTENIVLFIFLIFITIIWQTVCFVQDFHIYTKQTEYYNPHHRVQSKTPKTNEELNSIYPNEKKFANTLIRYCDDIDRLLQSNTPHPSHTLYRQRKEGFKLYQKLSEYPTAILKRKMARNEKQKW